MKHITVPLDFSPESLKGMDLALLFASKTSVHVHMIHVLQTEPGSVLFSQDYQKAEQQFEKIYDQFADRFEPGSRLTYSIAAGKVYEEVLNYSEADPSGIIALSSHGQSGFEDFFLGGQAFRIVSASMQPVITIRKNPVPRSIGKLVLPIDTTRETRQKVPAAAQIARLFGASVFIAAIASSRGRKVQDRLSAYVRQVKNYFEQQQIPCSVSFLIGNNLADLTVGYSEEIGADLMVIMSEQEVSMTNLVLGNYAQQVLNKAEIPVLNITPKPMHRMGFEEIFLHSWS